jgi:hypothetical protein
MSRLALTDLAFFAAFPVLAMAQGNGSISGTISDPSGAGVPSARVSVVEQATGSTRSATPEASGFYTVSPLSPGDYRVVIEAAGFQRFEQRGIALRVDDRLRVDARLQLGAQTEVVSVNSQAIAVNTVDGVMRSVVDVKRMVDLPLNGRSPLQLLLLAPGVLPSPATGLGTSFQPQGQQFVASSGSKANAVNYILDGGDNMDTYRDVANSFPNPDILQEFSVQTNNYSAEYGGRAGGVVNAVTKSGTNSFHGTAFEFVRNADFNARNFFAATTDGLKRNQYGGTIGGPVWIPHLYNGKNRTFFFFGAQETSVRQTPATSSARVLTNQQRAGDFSALVDGRGNPVAIKDPKTGLPFPGNVIPSSRLDPVFQNFLKLVPGTSDPSGIVRYVIPVINDDLQYNVRIDHSLTPNDRLFGRFFKDDYLQPNAGVTGNLLSYTNRLAQRATNATLDYTKVFTPSIIADWGFTFNRSYGLRGAVAPTTWTDLGSKVPPAGSGNDFQISIPNYFGITLFGNTPLVRNNFEYKGSIGWAKGNHNLRAGMSAIRRQYSIPSNDVQFHGNFTFGGALSGDNGADAILGLPSAFVQDTGYTVALRETDWVGWVTDDYKVTRRLTLNLGLRYEPFLPWVDTWARIPQVAQFRPGTQSTVYPNAPNGLLFYGDPGVSQHMAPSSLDRFAPRLGFAFDPMGDGKTAIRGGYGIFYDVLLPTEQVQQYASQLPTFTAVSSFAFPPSLSDPYAGRPLPFPAALPRSSDFVFPNPVNTAVRFYSPNFTNPYTQQWNLTVERQLFGPATLVRVTYQGSKGTRLPLPVEADPAAYIAGQSTTANTNARRPYAPAFNSILIAYPDANSTYHGLVLSMERRFAKHWSASASYTWSKGIDDTDNVTSANTSSVPDPFNYALNRGPSSSDRTHAFVLSYLWELPALSRAPALIKYIAGGWQNNGILSLYSGLPFSILSGVDNSFSGIGQDHADLTGVASISGDRSKAAIISQYFNTQAFARNALGTFGNTGRDILRGPGTANFDWSLFKNIPIAESRSVQFRAEFFNLFNHANLGQPVNSFTNPTFGKILSAGNPRIIQLAVKVVF